MTDSESVEKAAPNLPWVEKYRPNALDELISHEDIINTIRTFIRNDKLPHLLFYGPPGTGKTSTILACAKEIYPAKLFTSMVLELNASDDRGIGIVRGQIMNFASTRTVFNSGYKLIILDEADAMTNDAQNALRRIIEKFTDNVRFCMICNYLSKIIPALQSRCTRFRFGPLKDEQILPRLEHVAESEKVKLTEDGKKALITLSNGDMRRVLNILQSCSMAFDEVSEYTVYRCTGHPQRKDITNVVNWALNEDFSTGYNNIQTLKTSEGLSLQDILTEVHLYVHRLVLPAPVKITLLAKMAELEARLMGGSSEKIQLGGFLAAFHKAREMIKEEEKMET